MSVAAGVRAFFGGVGFVAGTPAVWPLAWVPVVTAGLVFSGLAALAVWGLGSIGDSWTGAGALLAWMVRVLLGLVAMLVALLVAVALGQPLSGWALDRIVRRQERAMGLAEHPPQATLAQLGTSLKVTLTGLAIGVPVLAALAALSFFVPATAIVCVPLKLVVCALLAAWDLLDYPMSQRGMGVGARFAWMRAHFGAVLAFGIVTAVVLLVPGIGLFVLPMGVAGAARLVART